MLRDNLVVLGMRTNPAPQKTVIDFCCQCTIAAANAYRPVISNLFEVKRWMMRIGLQKLVVLACEVLHFLRQLVEQLPETRTGEVIQTLVLLPAA